MPSARPATAASRRSPRASALRAPRLAALREPMLRVRWDRAGRVALLVVLTVVVGLYAQRTMAYFSTSAQSSQQQAIVDRLQRDNAQLVREQQSLSQPATIVRDARAVGMVRPGERPFVITGHAGH
jgi:cell division protein FtsB